MNLSNKRGINIDRARRGFVELKSFGDKIRNENYEPAEGFFISFLKIIADHPDILSMEKFWMDSREEQKKLIYALIKSINTKIQVGWHIDHGMSWDLITRTFWDYSKMGQYSDWLSVALYFDSMG